jgi:hypothetical protein
MRRKFQLGCDQIVQIDNQAVAVLQSKIEAINFI